MPPALLYFFSSALAIYGLLWFRMNFRITFSTSVKDAVGIYVGFH